VFTFGLKDGYEAGRALVGKVKLFSHLANLGDTRSLIIYPAPPCTGSWTKAHSGWLAQVRK
jgi:O-acetylhomoserine/O-acetylserine sulfhydrylase-like pyridoxal-dependent enzyme